MVKERKLSLSTRRKIYEASKEHTISSYTPYLDLKVLSERYGVSEATIRNWSANGTFLDPLPRPPVLYRWRAEDVKEWERHAFKGI